MRPTSTSEAVSVSNLEAAPAEVTGRGGEPRSREVEVLTARDVPLGGPRAMRVRRTLPQRARSLIGAWCFADHYGPDDVALRPGMDVPPHPHTGLQTVSWLFAGEVEHRDSLGRHALVRPGELNLMTSGHGICHSEVSTPATTVLHGVQLWVALPDSRRNGARDFQHYVPPAVGLGAATARVFLGTLAGERSPVATFSPLLGAEITLGPQARLQLPVEPEYEHGVLVDIGPVSLSGARLERSELGYLPPGSAALELANLTGAPARVLLLGGAPFAEDIVMWWNFVGRSHEEIVAFRAAWQDELDQFGSVEGYTGTLRRLPAPVLPNIRLRPRTRQRPPGEYALHGRDAAVGPGLVGVRVGLGVRAPARDEHEARIDGGPSAEHARDRFLRSRHPGGSSRCRRLRCRVRPFRGELIGGVRDGKLRNAWGLPTNDE
jgi:quercetin 2,3-dioxygenase